MRVNILKSDYDTVHCIAEQHISTLQPPKEYMDSLYAMFPLRREHLDMYG